MKIASSFASGLVAVALATAACAPNGSNNGRGVTPSRPLAESQIAPFDREQSAGLFVGVRKFQHHNTLEVPFAVDDAVDLAYRFAMDRRVDLLRPDRVLLALSGRPMKEESQRRLDELLKAGARKVDANTSSDLLLAMRQQADVAGQGGIVVLSIATHGFLSDGVPYILSASSLFHERDTSLSAAKLFDIVASSKAQRSVIFVDACRERITPDGPRSVTGDLRTGAPIVKKMNRVAGQVIFYAASAGNYAWDDKAAGNGVFTKAVLDGLSCKATTGADGLIRVDALDKFVEEQVREWIRTHKLPVTRPATQLATDGGTRRMPLCDCTRPATGPARMERSGSAVTAFDKDGKELWRKDVGAPVLHSTVNDLDADGRNEVVIGVHDQLFILDERGERVWEFTESMPLGKFITASLFYKHRSEVVGLWSDRQSSRLSIFDGDGKRRGAYDYAGTLRHVMVDRPTAQYNQKIVVASDRAVFVLDPKRVSSKKPVWYGEVSASNGTVERLHAIDSNHDGKQDIAITLSTGRTFYLDFHGKLLAPKNAPFSLLRK